MTPAAPPLSAPGIQIEKTLPIVCDECGGKTFIQTFILRRASKFLTASAEDSILTIPVLSCTGCGHVNDEFLPAPLRTPTTA